MVRLRLRGVVRLRLRGEARIEGLLDRTAHVYWTGLHRTTGQV